MIRRTLFALPLVLSSACQQTEYMEDAVADNWLEMELEASESVAGDAVGYLVEMVFLDGTREQVDAVLTSELESPLYYTNSSLFALVAGDHEIVANVTWNEEDYLTHRELAVLAGPAAELDLALADYSTVAGEGVDYSVGLWDRYGNELDASGVVVACEDIHMSIQSQQVVAGSPGVYEITATQGELQDDESLVVVTGPPISIELTLSDTEIELYETTNATVIVRDAYGNQTDDPWDLRVEAGSVGDPADVSLSYNNLTFWGEGSFTVVASVELPDSGGTLEDSVGPLLVDSTGPELTIIQPARGAFVEGLSGTVAGTAIEDISGLAELTVNGDVVAVQSDDSFSTTVLYEFGTNLLETVAIDGDNNATDDLRAPLAGDYYAYGYGIADGIVARLNEGEGGLGELEVLAEGMVTSSTLDDMIPSPVFEDYSEDCYDPCFGLFGGCEICVTWYEVELYVSNPYLGSTDFVLDPQTGELVASFAVYDISLDWSASGTVVYIGYSGSGDITADSIAVEMGLVPYVSGGRIYVSISYVDVDTNGFYFDWDSWLYDVLSWFGADGWISDTIAYYLEAAVEDALYDEVPDLIEEALQDLEIAFTFDLEDNSYDVDAVPYNINVDDVGLDLSLETYVTAASWLSPNSGSGSLWGGYAPPTYGSTPGMLLSLSGDFINQALYAFWGGGILDMEMGGEELGLDLADLEFIFPDMTELNIVTEALLPPVVMPGSGGDLLEMQIGDLELSIYGGPVAEENLVLRTYITIFAGMDIAVDGDATLLATLGDPEIYFDVVHPEANTLGASDTEDLLDALVPLFLPVLTEALGEIPIPEIEGFGLTGIVIEAAGEDDAYLNLGGDLALSF